MSQALEPKSPSNSLSYNSVHTKAEHGEDEPTHFKLCLGFNANLPGGCFRATNENEIKT